MPGTYTGASTCPAELRGSAPVQPAHSLRGVNDEGSSIGGSGVQGDAMQSVIRTITDAFHRPGSTAERWVTSFVWILIVVSIGLFLHEQAWGRAGALGTALNTLDDIILVLFIIEIIGRVGTFEPPATQFYELSPGGRIREHITGRLRFMFSPLLVIDLLSVLAVYPPFRGLRALRFLRLLRSARLFRYSSPILGIGRAVEENRLLFSLGFGLFGFAALVGGFSIFLVERASNPGMNTVGDGVWWAIVTLTTVGYGDLTPVTGLGKVVAGVVMVSGMVFLALFAGIVSQSLMSTVLTLRAEQFRMSSYVNHIVVCGYEPGARMLLDTLATELDLERTPVVLFAPEARPDNVPPEYLWVQGDPTKESELEKARVAWARAVLIIGRRSLLPPQSDANTILIAFTIRRYMKRHAVATKRHRILWLVAEILDAENVEHARTAGANEVIETTRIGFSLVAHAIDMPGTASVMGGLADVNGHSVYVGRAPSELALPATYAEVSRHLKEHYQILLLGMRTGPVDQVVNPPESTMVTPRHELVYIATTAKLPGVST
ncbi:MAG: voltage-gated potassium channel [Myxococcota bacterium]